MIEIRDGLTVDEYHDLRRSVGWNIKNIHIVENAIKNSVIIKKAIYDNKVIGMGRVIGDGLYYLVVDVVVDPKYQKRGIGKKIIDEIIKEIENRTEKGQSSSINLMSMGGKEEFYEKCGFTKVPFGYTGYGMIKRIEK
ncbi:MAG: GNAT family N-acetyltransferase [Lachnospiraceae bacterium]|nr:GNAT family N-acetyltransferase [Lachnospiraceae bacterium]